MLVICGADFLPAFSSATSTLLSAGSNRMLEQLPRSRPSQVSFFLATHSLLRRLDSFLVVQHFPRSQILILMSSSDPTAPIWTSIFLKTMLGVEEEDLVGVLCVVLLVVVVGLAVGLAESRVQKFDLILFLARA